MSRIRRIALLAIGSGLVVAAPASAATTIGSLPPAAATVNSCPGGGPYTVWQNQAVSGAVTAPAAGVITAVRTQQSAGNAGSHFKVKVIDYVNRSFSPSATVTVRNSSDALTIAGSGSPESFAVHLPIAAGQGIALFSSEPTDCNYDTSDSGDQILFNGDPEPAAGTSISAQDGSMSARVPLEATIEPDADGDGYGDETQDACPNDPTRQAAPCVVDLGLTARATPSTIGVGDVAVLSGTITNPGPGSGF